ncbi:cell division protein FtsQ/DivIB [Rickettsiales bacterium LUAb2]
MKFINKKLPKATKSPTKVVSNVKSTKSKAAYLLTLLIISICAFIVYFLYSKIDDFTNTNLPVKELKIEGASTRVKQQINNSFANLIGANMVDIRINNIKSQIISMPWVANVSVRKSYPNTIDIKIIEKKPLLIWENDDGEFFVINSENKIVRKSNVSDYKNLILIKQGKVALDRSDDLRFIIYKNYDLLSKISKLEFVGYRWNIYLSNGILIELPESNVDKAIDKIISANNKYQILSRDIDYIDARIPNKLFIMPKQNNQNS